MVRARLSAVLLGAVFTLLPVLARAHISVTSGPGFANTSQEVAFGVGHGCSGLDTYAVRIDIPTSVSSVRAVRSDFGRPSVQTDNTGAVTAVTWQKPDADVLPGDTSYYKLVLRFRVPNQPFTTVYFPVHQTCKAANGDLTVVDWIGTPTAAAPEPAAALKIVPPRKPGWNKVTVPVALTDLSVYFGDALIVWKGSSAYSANADTTALISTTSGVSALTSLAANDVVWVRY